MPEIYRDETYGRTSHWELSTSQLSSRFFDGWGYGEGAFFFAVSFVFWVWVWVEVFFGFVWTWIDCVCVPSMWWTGWTGWMDD